MIIAVDGPAASGKGTIARALAQHYGLPYLDTGLLYRAVGVAVTRGGGDPDNEQDSADACGFPDDLLVDPALRSEDAGALASRVSRHPLVRTSLLELQRAFAHQPGGAVLDGRDIGTVIAPEADAKLFITASIAVRAERRYAELTKRGDSVTLESIAADLAERDARDTARASAPLRQAEDASLLDTSNLGIGAAVQQAISLVDARLKNRR